MVRKQIRAGGRIRRDRDGAIVNPVIEPVHGAVQGASQLGDGKATWNLARMRLVAVVQHLMVKAGAAHRIGQNRGRVHGGTKARGGELLGDGRVVETLTRERQDTTLQTRRRC